MHSAIATKHTSLFIKTFETVYIDSCIVSNSLPSGSHHIMRYVYYFISIEYSDSTHTWKLVGVASGRQLGSKERIDEKMEKIKQFAREAKQQPADDRAEAQGLSDAVHRELLLQVEELQQEVQSSRERSEVRIKLI